MKKLNYLLLGLAGLTLASCSQEDVVAPGSGDGSFSITVKLPADMGTRALGDGLAANTLVYAVYDVTNSTTPQFSFQGEASFNNSLETTLSLNLISGKQYRLAFFACSPDALSVDGEENVYTFTPDSETPNITVNYEKMTGTDNNADAYDCFYKFTDAYTVGTSDNPYEVLLTRPVAQINWGTSELGENNEINVTFGENGEFIQTNLVVEGQVYTQFNIFDSNVDASSLTTTTLFGTSPAAVPVGTPFPVDPTTYDYIACQYILAPANGTTYGLTLNINNGGDNNTESYNDAVEVLNAPVQANYRTNIYGNLLSTNATFNITKDKFFAGEYDLPQAWDGTSITFPQASADGKTFTIAQSSDLAGLAAMVNGTNGQTADNFEGKTIELSSDVDLGGHSLMIGTATRSGSATTTGSKGFAGVFDGKGNTISNLKITGSSTADDVAAFIPWLDGANASVKNVTFDNLQIDAPQNEQAGVVGLVTNGAVVDGVTVSSGSVNAKEAAGGVVGRMIKSGTIQNCVNYASVNASSKNAGGIAGTSYYTAEGENLLVQGCDNYGKISGGFSIGGILGVNTGTVEECNNYGEVNGTENAVGGVVGLQQSAGYITNCTNNATVTATSNVWGTGGIAGWVKYDNSASYPVQNRIEVKGCTNTADVTGGTNVGGIVGSWYASGTCNGNTNKAGKITAAVQFVGGIIGSQTFSDGAPGPVNVEDPSTVMLYVTNNTTTTTIDNLFGNLKALIVYVNTDNIELSGNTPSDN